MAVMEGEGIYEEIQEREAMIRNPFHPAASKFGLESVPESPESPPSKEVPLKIETESKPATENLGYEMCSTQGMLSSENRKQTQSKFKKAAFGRSILLVGFILVGSAALVSMGISLWTISRVSLSISKLEFQASNTEQIKEFQAFKNNISENFMELMNNISEHYMEFQASKRDISEKIMKLQASKNNLSEEIMKLKASENNIYEQIMELRNVSGGIQKLELKIAQLQNTADAVYDLRKASRSFSSKINTIIQTKQYDSCYHVLLLNPSSPSDHYWIRSSNGSAVYVYCDFNRQCGCDGPSTWTRVAFLNMSDPNQVCPKNWTIFSNKVRRCSREKTTITGCNSVFYSTFGMTYSRVCGRIIGYQQSTTDGFQGLVSHQRNIDKQYVDGVSLTHGSVGSRQHIWSFASTLGEATNFGARYVCDCSNNNNWPYNTSFVGNDYFCDSGNHVTYYIRNNLYSRDPLWDGQGCDRSSTCCQFNTPPWFCKTLPQSTTDDLEVRICHGGNDEDTPVQLVELYVQ